MVGAMSNGEERGETAGRVGEGLVREACRVFLLFSLYL